MLRRPHGSVPGNPLLAESLYLAKYIERIGTGTRDMILEAYLVPALNLELVEMTRPDKPRCSKQKYRLTARGRAVIEKSRQVDAP